jgi:hypothetical protein
MQPLFLKMEALFLKMQALFLKMQPLFLKMVTFLCRGLVTSSTGPRNPGYISNQGGRHFGRNNTFL